MTHRSKPAGIFADPRDGIMVRFENNRVRKITSAERLVVVACLAALHSTSAAGETTSSDKVLDFREFNEDEFRSMEVQICSETKTVQFCVSDHGGDHPTSPAVAISWVDAVSLITWVRDSIIPSEAITADVLAGAVACYCFDDDSRRYCLDKHRCFRAEAQSTSPEVKAEGGRTAQQILGDPRIAVGLSVTPVLIPDANCASGQKVEWMRTHPASPPDVEAIARIIDPGVVVDGVEYQTPERRENRDTKARAVAALLDGGQK